MERKDKRVESMQLAVDATVKLEAENERLKKENKELQLRISAVNETAIANMETIDCQEGTILRLKADIEALRRGDGGE